MDLSKIVAGYLPDPNLPATYVVTMPAGEPVTCRRLTSYGALQDFERGLDEFWERIQRGEIVPDAKGFEPQSKEEARAAYRLMFHTVEPTQFDEASACRLLKAPLVMQHLSNAIRDAQVKDILESRIKSLEEGKGGSETTGGNASEQSNASGAAAEEVPTS